MKVVRFVIVLVAAFAGAGVFGGPGKIVRHPGAVQGKYVIVLHGNTPPAAVDNVAKSLAATYQLQIDDQWADSIKGFLAGVPENMVERVANDPRVSYIEQDFTWTQEVPLSSTQWTNYQPSGSSYNYEWFLDRLDEKYWAQRDNTQNMCTEGRDVYVYLLNDTGIYADHDQFVDDYPPGNTTSRVVGQYNFRNGVGGEPIGTPCPPSKSGTARIPWNRGSFDGCR